MAGLCITSGPAFAQTRSDTGRHKPQPAPVEEEDSENAPKAQPAGPYKKRWVLGFSGGVQVGSDLFRVEVLDGAGVPWDPETGGGFQASRFTASLDRNFSFGLFVARDLSSIWSVKADLGYSRMDVAAEALLGQYGGVFLFDRFSVLNLAVGVEARLAQASSYPFFEASFLVSQLSPARADGLEQTNLGGRLGLGYVRSIDNIWELRLEARMSRTGFSVGDYVPQAEIEGQPVIEFTSEDHLVYFEFLIGVQVIIN